jgi:4-alpha-glucanotransferase
MERASGVLLHISSLPNEYGIGSFGQSAYEFVDFLVETGQKYWQILPLTTISFGDSPYQSFSAFAGNTHFIDLEELIREDYLKEEDVLGRKFGEQLNKVDYDKVSYERRPLLEKAVTNFIAKEHHKESEFEQFILENEHWLLTYCQYMTVKEINNFAPWYVWPEAVRNYDKDYITNYVRQHEKQMYYHLITQYWFFKQWKKLKNYTNRKNIQIIGDIPIYVARDSVEMWTQSELFLVDEQKNPTVVSGVPPDAFSDDGQHWGNPIYDWPYMKRDGYKWWILRMKESFKLYDVVRIDHFRGFESYWEIPSSAKTAATGQWKKGPGIDLFNEMKNQLGEINVIAEDLGFITKEVIELREQTGFPGMKILQHGFSNTDNLDLIHNYSPNTIAYVGTHDNATALDWYLNYADSDQRDQMDTYLNRRLGEHVSDALNRGIASSASKIVIYTMQDLLHLGREGRMNIPSTIGNNWNWRMLPDALTNDIKEKLYLWTKTYFRMNKAIVNNEIKKGVGKKKFSECINRTDEITS